MQAKLRNTALLILAVILLYSCKGVEDITFTGINGFRLKGMENNKVTFNAGIGVHNPSSVGFKVREVNLKASVDGIFVGTLTTPDQVRVPAHCDSTYNMNFSLEMANVITGASTLYSLSRKNQVTVKMQGYVKARSWLTLKTVEINETQVIDLASMNR